MYMYVHRLNLLDRLRSGLRLYPLIHPRRKLEYYTSNNKLVPNSVKDNGVMKTFQIKT